MKNNRPIQTRHYAGVDASSRKNERNEKIIAAGLEAFGTQGYAKATIKGICQIAGLTERYFYESFQSKEELLCAVYRRLINELETDALAIIQTPDISPDETASQSLKMFYRHFQTDPRRARVQLFEILGVSPRVDKEYQTAMRTLADWIIQIYAAVFPGIDQQWLRSTIIPAAAAGAIIEVANQWVLDGFKTEIDDMVAQAISIFMAVGSHVNDARNLT